MIPDTPDLEVRQLRAFILLVDHGSMSAAARAMGVSQSTVSEIIASLERKLATPVVTRRRGARVLPLYALGSEVADGRLRVLCVHPELPCMRLVAMRYRPPPLAHPAVDALLVALRGSLQAVVSATRGSYHMT